MRVPRDASSARIAPASRASSRSKSMTSSTSPSTRCRLCSTRSLRRCETATPLNVGVAASYEVRPSGFEPLASSSGGMRSIQLSYGRLVRPPLPTPVSRRGCDDGEANKPSSVSAACARAHAMEADHFSGTTVACRLEQPTRDSDGAGRASPLFGLAPGGVCRATAVASSAVVSYTAVSPLPVPLARPSAVCSLLHFPSPHDARPLAGTLALRSSDFPPAPRDASDPHSLPQVVNQRVRPSGLEPETS
jgi:hypothetical protein